MSITSIARLGFMGRLKQLDRYASEAETLQMQTLLRLLRQACQTEWGVEHRYEGIKTYEQFAALCPVNTYEELKQSIDRMRHGEKNVLWPGRVRWYAKSSGTTNDKSKFIPVSAQGLKDTHYQGGFDAVAWYLHQNPKSRIFDGRALVLGGSHSPNYNLPGTLVGDLSAILIENMNPLVNMVRIPGKKVALLSDFETKRERIARIAMTKNVSNLSGVPSWMMSVLTRVLELSGKNTLDEIWPNLEMFFHGGVSFAPYRKQYNRLITNPNMHYMETYNASEGFFGVQDDPLSPSLSLMVDYGVFYEFIPMEELEKEHPTVLPLWAVELGQNYAMVISTSSGLWRYMIGDTVKFTSLNPYKFIITGRTKFFINAFGEELIVDNAEKGIQQVCSATGAIVREYTAAPVFMDEKGKCRHQWLIEFDREPEDLAHFATLLDKALQQINSDYEAKRHKDITLQPLQIVKARPQLFDDWLKSKGKLGGQHKIPRLSNNRQYIDELLQMNS